MDKINTLNKQMEDFYKSWEFENTEEQFISLNAELETTSEMKTNIEKFEKMTTEIENFINDENNFESITENWDAINLTLLDILIATFEINIEEFVNRVETSEVRKDIKEFLLER